MKKKTFNEIISSKKEYIFFSAILISFIVLTIIISFKHEYWTDETNAWLIAQDSSLIELFTKYLHTDGHPALFHLIIKLFSLFGLSFNNFRFISILFSSLGVAIFLFKSNFKLYLKILLPFSYFIFYQYTVITRGYCLILLLFSLIALLWKKRNKKPFLFAFLLILLINLEPYTFFIAGSIYLSYIVDYIIDYRKNKKHDKKYLCSLIILFFSFIITIIYVYPRSDNTYIGNYGYYFISDSFITPHNCNQIIKGILSTVISLGLFIIYYFKKSKKELFELIVFIMPVYFLMNFKYCNLWHYGIPFLLFLFIYWIHDLNKNKIINLFLLLTCIFQISWSIKTSIYEYKEKYAPVKDIADFIKKYDYENLKIYGQSFYESAILAYFDHNIYTNWNQDIRFFYWSKQNKYYNYSLEESNLINIEEVDIYIASPYYSSIERDAFKEKYIEYEFNGASYFENSKYEDMISYVYVKKGINKKA